MSKTMIWAVALGMTMTATALAQAPLGADEPPPVVPADPPVTTEPPPVPPQPPQPPVVQATPKESTGRPHGWAIGIGTGYALPTSIQTPNVTSARIRFASGFTLEPRLVIQATTVKRESDTSDTSDAQRELTAASLLRFPMVQRGKFELLLLGYGSFGIQSTDPDGPDNNTSTSTLGVGWGVAVDWWITEHWSVSFSATNPIFTLSKTSMDQPAPIGDTSTTNTTVGAVWNPTIAAMIHLYN